MTKARVTVLILAIGLLLRAQAADDARVQQVDAIFAGLSSNQAPGAAVLVIGNGKNIYERGFGVTDLRTMHAIDAKTNFRLASVTKQFTAMAVMLLVHDGKLRYEDSLTNVFPDFPEFARQITIRNLLNHTSVLRDYEDLMTGYDLNLPDGSGSTETRVMSCSDWSSKKYPENRFQTSSAIGFSIP